MRRAAIALMIMLGSAGAASAASVTADQKLALRVMRVRGDDFAARGAATSLIHTMADSFAAGAPLRDVPVDAKALRRAVRLHVKASRPKFVDATMQAYTSVYSSQDLAQLVDYYRRSPRKRGKLDAGLAAKFREVADARSTNVAPLRAGLADGLFAAYCGRATCNDATRGAIAAFGHS